MTRDGRGVLSGQKSLAKVRRQFPEPVVSVDDTGEIVVGWKFALNLDKDEADE